MSNNYITLYRTSNYQITENFNVSEFFAKNQPNITSHIINIGLFQVAQRIREYFDMPSGFSSTFRSVEHNAKEDGAKDSAHLTGDAIDIRPIQYSKRYNEIRRLEKSLNEKGQIYYDLKNLGVKGIIIYDRFVHIDFKDRGYFYYSNKKKA